MKLSFVIPAYNEEAYLPKCLEAVLKEKQKGKYDIEIIVVNNASTDSTRKVALSYPEVIVVDEPVKGLSAARHAGFSVSTGDIIANIDSDSVLTPEWTDTVMNYFSKNSDLIALSGPFVYHDLSIFHNLLVRFQYRVDFVFNFLNIFIRHKSPVLQGGNFVVKKSALEKIGGFNKEFTFWGEDTNLAQRLKPIGPVIFTFDLPIYSSGRRLKKEGMITMSIKYMVNFFWTIIFDRPFSKTYMDIRQPEDKQQSFKTNLNTFNNVLFFVNTSFIFIVFTIMGGSVYLYNSVIDTVQPMTATASDLPTSHHMFKKIEKSIIKIHQKIEIWEDEISNY